MRDDGSDSADDFGVDLGEESVGLSVGSESEHIQQTPDEFVESIMEQMRRAPFSPYIMQTSPAPTMTPTIRVYEGPSLTSTPVSGNSPAPPQTGSASVSSLSSFFQTPTPSHRDNNVAQSASNTSNVRGIDQVARKLQFQTPQRASTVEQPASASASTDSSRSPQSTSNSLDSTSPSPIPQRLRQPRLNFGSPGSPVQFVEEEELRKKGRKVKPKPKSNPGSSNGKNKRKTPSTTTKTPKRQRRTGSNDEIEEDQEDDRNRLNRRISRNGTLNDSGISGDRSGLQGGDDADDDENNDLTSEEGAETDDSDDNDEGFRVQELSFHYLAVEKLRKKFIKNKKTVTELSELELIQLIMDEVNYSQSKQKNNDYQLQKLPSSENEMEVENDEDRFQCLLYYQKKERTDPLLAKFEVSDNREMHFNKILFYHRKDEIFAGTIDQTWQALQVYCCYDFPCLISGRLTYQGNVEEKSKHIIGIRRSTQSVKKLATSFDQINTITQSFTKHLRPDSSLFWLKEFQPRRKNQNVKLAFGLASVRIKKAMKLDNIPEILEHFSTIRKGQPTLRFGDPDQREEIQIDEFPAMRVVPSGPEWQQAERRLCEILQKFMHHQDSEVVKKLDLCDKRVEDFCKAEEFQVYYDNDLIHEFSRCPTVLEVLISLRENCKKLTDRNVRELKKFSNQLKNHVTMTFTLRGQTQRRKLLQLIEGEITMDNMEYIKSMGQWWTVRNNYYVEIQEKFMAVLNSQEPKFFEMSSELHLPFMWLDQDVLHPETNEVVRKKMTSVRDYLEQYRNKPEYFFPPETEALEVMSSQVLEVSFVNASDSQDSEVEAETQRHQQEIQNLSKNCCDMFRVFKREDGSYDFHLYYIFDRFDSAIRDASTRIAKSLDILFKGEYASSSLLRKVYNYCSGSVANATPTPSTSSCNNFRAYFGSFDVFQQNFLKGNNVTIVAGFLTGPRKVEEPKGKITNFVRSSRDEEELPAEEVSLDRERSLETNFSELNVDTLILNNLPEQLVEKICSELEIYGPSDEVNFDRLLMATKVRDRLLEKEYCLEKESGDYPLTGKMLKLRGHAGFKLFEDSDVNKELFKLIQRNFLTRFPGFIHKLETIGIFDEVTQKPKLSLKITEIPIEEL